MSVYLHNEVYKCIILTAISSTGIGTGIFLLKHALTSLAAMRQIMVTMLTTRVPMFVFGRREQISNTVWKKANPKQLLQEKTTEK